MWCASGSSSEGNPPNGDDLGKVAETHDLEPITCPSCAGAGAGCGNCGGSGRLWHSPSGVTLSDSGVRRLVRKKAQSATASSSRSKRST
jgi:hypothetical protein